MRFLSTDSWAALPSSESHGRASASAAMRGFLLETPRGRRGPPEEPPSGCLGGRGGGGSHEGWGASLARAPALGSAFALSSHEPFPAPRPSFKGHRGRRAGGGSGGAAGTVDGAPGERSGACWRGGTRGCRARAAEGRPPRSTGGACSSARPGGRDGGREDAPSRLPNGAGEEEGEPRRAACRERRACPAPRLFPGRPRRLQPACLCRSAASGLAASRRRPPFGAGRRRRGQAAWEPLHAPPRRFRLLRETGRCKRGARRGWNGTGWCAAGASSRAPALPADPALLRTGPGSASAAQ